MSAFGPQPRLIASDVDGTLINSAERVPERLRAAIRRLSQAETHTHFVLATGRPARWTIGILDQLAIKPICICSNGAVIYDSDNDEIVQSTTLSPTALNTVAAITHEVLEPHGEIGIAVERSGTSAYDKIHELFLVTPTFIHAWESDEHGVEPEEIVLGKPATKLIVRSNIMSSKEMYDILRPAVEESIAHITYSMPDGLLEVTAPGVTKALGITWLAERHGIAQEDILCFGDMPNDIEMLQWAGRGVAMSNASAEVKDIADYITGSNEDAGVADVLESWF